MHFRCEPSRFNRVFNQHSTTETMVEIRMRSSHDAIILWVCLILTLLRCCQVLLLNDKAEYQASGLKRSPIEGACKNSAGLIALSLSLSLSLSTPLSRIAKVDHFGQLHCP